MLADKSLISVTLAATFASGLCVGYAAKSGGNTAGAPAADAAVIYAPQLRALESRGYDEAEMSDARAAYADYLREYETWWNAFLDTQRAATDHVDEKLEKKLVAIEARHAVRTRAK